LLKRLGEVLGVVEGGVVDGEEGEGFLGFLRGGVLVEGACVVER
jgi:hypothetical protein